jgi:hypothetical protein
MVRCSPIVLPLSKQARLTRLHKEAVYKAGPQVLHLPLARVAPGAAPATLALSVSALLDDLVPVLESGTEAVASEQ